MSEIQHLLEQAHTARQLIELLQDVDPEARVLFTCNYGDYHNTQQALPVGEIIEHESNVLHTSAYSQSGVAYTDPDEEPEPDEEQDEEVETFPVVLLS